MDWATFGPPAIPVRRRADRVPRFPKPKQIERTSNQVREAGRSRGDARERSINVFSEGITMATIDKRVYPNVL
jgi:hypothetical protein